MISKIIAFLAAVLVTYVLAVLAVSQFNIATIAELGFPSGFAERLQTTLSDQVGMLELYLPLLAVALLIAFCFTGFLLTRFIPRSLGLYALAGLVAVVAMHLIMVQVFEIHPVAPTRTLAGLLSQGLAGLLGGAVFYRWAHGSATKDSLA